MSIFEILDQYRAIHKLPQSEKVYLFFDEITHQDQWQQQLKTLYDRENVHVIASSSNSSVFVDDRAFLTGRSKLIEVKPLDFDEWLIFKNIALKKVDSTLYASYFEDYLQAGGMPEYVLHGDRDYLKRLVEQLLYKDIIAKHNIKLKSVIQDLFLLLMERSGKQISINSVSKILGVSPSNIVRYLDFFRDTFLISTIKRYGKTNEKILSPEKIYSGDLGLRNAYTCFRDKGALFENYVYLKIKETNPFYYYDKGIEIDFITDKYFAKQYLIECKYNSTMNEKQQQLFDSMELANKLIINGYNDLHKLAEIYP